LKHQNVGENQHFEAGSSYRDRPPERLKSAGEQNKDKIIKEVASSEPDGKSTGELHEITKLHRDTIYTLCKDLIDDKYLVKSGKFGKYRLGPKALEDSALYGFLFGSRVASKFSDIQPFICEYSKFCKNKYCRELLNQSPNWRARNEDLHDQLELFEFALRIGAIITYELIQSAKYAKPEYLSAAKKNERILKWIENSVRPFLLLNLFRGSMPVAKRRKDISGIGKKSQTYSLLALEDKKLTEIEELYTEIFPRLFSDLEKIRTSISLQV
jgi:hypothetical protein